MSEEERIRRCLEEQRCPWCDRDGLKVVASHVSRTHGITPRELRDRAGLRYSDSILDPDFAREWAEVHKANLILGETTRGVTRSTRHVSERERAARRAAGDHLRAYAADHPEQRILAAEASALARQKYLKVPIEQWPAVRARYEAGETKAAIARDFGVSAGQMSRILRQAGAL